MKNALLTGATGSIGKSIAYKLGSEGYDLTLVSRSINNLERLKSELSKKYNNITIHCFDCDVSSFKKVESLFKKILLKKLKISILINCAGRSGGGLFNNIMIGDWIDVINTNLNSVFYVTKCALNNNLIPKGGRIINISSTGGKQGVIYGCPYSASKHGVVGFTKSLGLELARSGSGITVNSVCPGFVESDMAVSVREHYSKIWNTDLSETKKRVENRIPIGRYITPEEVAGMVSYLASPIADGITAQAINVCGGLGNY